MSPEILPPEKILFHSNCKQCTHLELLANTKCEHSTNNYNIEGIRLMGIKFMF